MAVKKLILTKEQIEYISEGEEFVYLSDLASKPDMGNIYSTEVSTDGSIDDGYPTPITSDDKAHTMTNNWRGNSKLAGMGPIVVREMSKKDWSTNFLFKEELEHGNERLKHRKFGANGDSKSYTATKMAISRKKRAEDKLRNGSDEEKIKASNTLKKMHDNWDGLDAADTQYSAAKYSDEVLNKSKDADTTITNNNSSNTPKNGVFLN
jgi:hypothetical protein